MYKVCLLALAYCTKCQTEIAKSQDTTGKHADADVIACIGIGCSCAAISIYAKPLVFVVHSPISQAGSQLLCESVTMCMSKVVIQRGLAGAGGCIGHTHSASWGHQ